MIFTIGNTREFDHVSVVVGFGAINGSGTVYATYDEAVSVLGADNVVPYAVDHGYSERVIPEPYVPTPYQNTIPPSQMGISGLVTMTTTVIRPDYPPIDSQNIELNTEERNN